MNKNTAEAAKFYVNAALEACVGFTLATFCMAVFFTNHGAESVVNSAIMCISYLFIIFFFGKRLLKKLPAPALMIVIPIAPLLVLIIVLSLLPIIQKLHF